VSRTDDVVNGIKRMIPEGKLRPGERLPVEKLADAKALLDEAEHILSHAPQEHERLIEIDIAFLASSPATPATRCSSA
jgi:GntR family transcriptional repressor for pyruvate dehydrogenase complex